MLGRATEPTVAAPGRLGDSGVLSKKTVLVVGAGAGVEFEMPIGDELMKTIAADTNFDALRNEQTGGCPMLWRAVQSAEDPGGRNAHRAGMLISEGVRFTNSIDDFLYTHGEDETVVRVGKTAIAAAILKAEANSKLSGLGTNVQRRRQLSLEAVDRCWLHQLLNLLAPGVRAGERDTIFANLMIINFNYDRCIEVYLHAATQRLFGIDEQAASNLLTRLQIVHPYGTLGPLPWQAGSQSAVPFGDEIDYADLKNIAQRIKTFTEQSHDEDERSTWREAIRDCSKLVFLGFAFHKQNVELIRSAKPPEAKYRSVHAYATAFGASDAIQQLFKSRMGEIKATGHGATETVPVGCAKFMTDYGAAVFS